MADVKNMKSLKVNNFKKISGDASFRTFYRGKKSVLVFSKKDKQKNLLIYDAINKILIKNKIPAPKLINEKYKKNYIEIQDLGNIQILKLIKKSKTKFKIYKRVIELLIKMQKIKNTKINNFYGNKYTVPNYSKKYIFDEANLFFNWFISTYVKNLYNSHNKKKFKYIVNRLIANLRLPNEKFVHRDFHISNIMIYKKKLYLIDNQDAVIGNTAYDLASLIDDVRFKTTNKLKKKIYSYYITKNSNKFNIHDFKNDFDILSVLRNLKILGIFTRLAKRDNKKKYLKMLPYCWKLIQNRIDDQKIFEELKTFLKKKEFRKHIVL